MKNKGILLRESKEFCGVWEIVREKQKGRLMKERITKDVRYQEWTEVTLGRGITTTVRGHFFLCKSLDFF